MSEMIERMAEAAFRALYICDDDEEWSSAADSSCSGGAKAFRAAARAALAPVREHLREMLLRKYEDHAADLVDEALR